MRQDASCCRGSNNAWTLLILHDMRLNVTIVKFRIGIVHVMPDLMGSSIIDSESTMLRSRALAWRPAREATQTRKRLCSLYCMQY